MIAPHVGCVNEVTCHLSVIWLKYYIFSKLLCQCRVWMNTLKTISRIKEYSSFTFKTLYLISYFIFSKTVTTRGILKNWIKINDEKKDDKLLVLILIFKTRQTERSEKILGKEKSKPWCWYICYCCYNNMDYKLLK